MNDTSPFQAKVSEMLGGVQWLSDSEGYCPCPGKEFHTGRDGARDCKVYLEPVVTLSCFHDSCRKIVEERNRGLRDALRSEEPMTISPELARQRKEMARKNEEKEHLRHRARNSRKKLLKVYGWTLCQMMAESPTALPEDPKEHARKVVEMYRPGDIVWSGDIRDSGQPGHSIHFRSREERLQDGGDPMQFVCPSAFKPGCHSRSKENVADCRFLVVESDELNKDTVGGVFRWMADKVGMKLRCVVDTAGKSLHGWFDMPPRPVLEELRIVLPELGCDPKMFGASQPCRLPGALRDGNHQRLVYLGRAS